MFDGETSSADRLLNDTINSVQDSARMVPSNDGSTSSLLPEDGIFALPNASSDIPHDQLRMIENINSLISEVVILIFSYYHHLKLETYLAFHNDNTFCFCMIF